jgi:hypothetical protein
MTEMESRIIPGREFPIFIGVLVVETGRELGTKENSIGNCVFL